MRILDRFRKPPEVRLRNYADTATAAIENVLAQESAIGGALQIAANYIANALVAADVDGANADLFNPDVVHTIGQDLVIRGESAWIFARSGAAVSELVWLPDFELDATGRRIVYTVSGGEQRATSDALHIRYSRQRTTGHGAPPVGKGNSLHVLAARLELMLANEAGGPHGYIVAVPYGTTQDAIEDLKAHMKATRGKVTALEATAAGGGAGMSAAPRGLDYRQQRYGFEMEEYNLELYNSVYSKVLSANGVPPTLVSDGRTDSGQKQAYRRFCDLTMIPMGKQISHYARAAGLEVSFDFAPLKPDPLTERAKVFRELIVAGRDVEEALAISGLELEDDE